MATIYLCVCKGIYVVEWTGQAGATAGSLVNFSLDFKYIFFFRIFDRRCAFIFLMVFLLNISSLLWPFWTVRICVLRVAET